MSDKIIENNQVTIMGKVATEFSFSHEVFGEGFYMVEVEVKRLSNSEDRIPLMISERRDTGLYRRVYYGARTVPLLQSA